MTARPGMEDGAIDAALEPENLRLRGELMRAIGQVVQANGWTQAEAARACGVTQPRMSDLLRGKAGHFSLDALVNMAARLGRRVQVALLEEA